MKLFLSAILLLLCLENNAQAPPVIQWQKSIGGTKQEVIWQIKPTSDGGYVMAGNSTSNDGDLTGNMGVQDVWVVKTDATGVVQWQRNFGGSGIDNAYEILQAPDGGYVLVGNVGSSDGNIIGNHGGEDMWVAKLSAAGILLWQKCYGGSSKDFGYGIAATFDGGYIVGGETGSADGDVTGHHGGIDSSDAWIVKIDATGNLQWQKCFGGIKADQAAKVIQTSDGGYFFTSMVQSSDGDVACNTLIQDLWMVRLDNAGNIQWQTCGFNQAGGDAIRQTTDGGFIIASRTFVTTLPGFHGPGSDAIVLKLNATGVLQWQRLLGGSGDDVANSIQLTPDGGYIIAGSTGSADGDICNNKGQSDCWVVKLNSNGATQWQKTYGGSSTDVANSIALTPDGGYVVAGYSNSTDGDVSGNHGQFDAWIFKLSFPGVPLLPSVSIIASNTLICPRQNVTFIATPTNGGATPSYQWTINGVNAAANNDTVTLNTLNSGDAVNCILTSSSACVTSPTALSNTIAITVDATKNPANFLPADTAICNYGTIDLKASGAYKTYLWNTNATTPVLTISEPGIYWLQVTTDDDCPGSDTIYVLPKDCLKGFYMPTAFTPNGDGKNDELKPILGGNIKQYKFTITNRWGQTVFQTTDIGEGWDGKFKGIKQDSNVFIWTCTYQFEGEEAKFLKGTILLIR